MRHCCCTSVREIQTCEPVPSFVNIVTTTALEGQQKKWGRKKEWKVKDQQLMKCWANKQTAVVRFMNSRAISKETLAVGRGIFLSKCQTDAIATRLFVRPTESRWSITSDRRIYSHPSKRLSLFFGGSWTNYPFPWFPRQTVGRNHYIAGKRGNKNELWEKKRENKGTWIGNKVGGSQYTAPKWRLSSPGSLSAAGDRGGRASRTKGEKKRGILAAVTVT